MRLTNWVGMSTGIVFSGVVKRGINTVADLENRIINSAEYQIMLLKRCADNKKSKGYQLG